MATFRETLRPGGATRRTVLAAGAALAGATLAGRAQTGIDDAAERAETLLLVEQTIGARPVLSDRVRLVLPAIFSTGATVPLALAVETPMTQADHVRRVRVLAPRNPIVEIAGFRFVPGRSEPRVATRVRLARPQYVAAVAEMGDGALLMAIAFVDVATDGCI